MLVMEEWGRGRHRGVFGDVNDGATSNKIIDKEGFGDSATYLDSSRVVGRDSKIFNFNVESMQVEDKDIFERNVEVNNDNNDFW